MSCRKKNVSKFIGVTVYADSKYTRPTLLIINYFHKQALKINDFHRERISDERLSKVKRGGGFSYFAAL